MRVTSKLTRPLSPARRVAFLVLEAVETAGAYASDALRERSVGLETRDAGLAAQIVFGVLRFQGQLDYLIALWSGRAADRLDPEVRIALRSGIYQLRYLERIPAHAAVGESVEYVKGRKRSAAGFVNAVLRKTQREPVAWPDRSVELSCPEWLLRRWTGHFGAEAARGIAQAGLREPRGYVRLVAGAEAPEGLDLEATEVPGAWHVSGGGARTLRLHDISSQTLIPRLNLQPGMSYLDLCAAPGNKTAQALETPLALAIACDLSEKRIREVPPLCPRVVLDASEPLPFNTPFDRIFVDAPCSGTGTLGRNPEIKWRVRQQDLTRFGEKQAAMLRQAVQYLASGGRLLYATCSLEQEENEEVIRRVCQTHPDVQLVEEVWRIPGRDEGDGFYAAVLEWRPKQ